MFFLLVCVNSWYIGNINHFIFAADTFHTRWLLILLFSFCYIDMCLSKSLYLYNFFL